MNPKRIRVPVCANHIWLFSEVLGDLTTTVRRETVHLYRCSRCDAKKTVKISEPYKEVTE